MRVVDFDFTLPDDLIATRPANPRSASRLLVAGKDFIEDRRFSDLPSILRPGDLLVLNDTRVLPVRLAGKRTRLTKHGPVSARIEATLASPASEGKWDAFAKPLRKLQEGDTIDFGQGFSAHVESIQDGMARLDFGMMDSTLADALDTHGAMPLPPYISAKRPADEKDKADYQTVWARKPGAVAAPTASLHFDQAVIEALEEKGIGRAFVTLHVGIGTFLPVKVDAVADHKMHAEWGHVTEEAAARINETRARGGRIIPVGTTALRLIEAASGLSGDVSPWAGETDIFITPGYNFCVADALITNFHLPKSTLMMLVAALMGKDRIDEVYAHAIGNRYRFFSYGDASLLLPRE